MDGWLIATFHILLVVFTISALPRLPAPYLKQCAAVTIKADLSSSESDMCSPPQNWLYESPTRVAMATMDVLRLQVFSQPLETKSDRAEDVTVGHWIGVKRKAKLLISRV